MPEELAFEGGRGAHYGHIDAHAVALEHPALNKTEGLGLINPVLQRFGRPWIGRRNDLLHAVLEIEVVGFDHELAFGRSPALAHNGELFAFQFIILAIILEGGENTNALNGYAEIVLQQDGETVVLGLRLVAFRLEALGDGQKGRGIDHAVRAEDSL